MSGFFVNLYMKLNKDQIFKIAKAKILELEIDRITNLFSHLPIDIKSFYNCFPIGSDEYKTLKELTGRFERSDIEK